MKLNAPEKLEEEDFEINTEEEFTDENRKFLIQVIVDSEKKEILALAIQKEIMTRYNNYHKLIEGIGKLKQYSFGNSVYVSKDDLESVLGLVNI